MNPPRWDVPSVGARRAASWIDPLPEQTGRPDSEGTPPMWFVLGGVSAAAVAAVAIAARALRIAATPRGN